jgi:hypothetical protein
MPRYRYKPPSADSPTRDDGLVTGTVPSRAATGVPRFLRDAVRGTTPAHDAHASCDAATAHVQFPVKLAIRRPRAASFGDEVTQDAVAGAPSALDAEIDAAKQATPTEAQPETPEAGRVRLPDIHFGEEGALSFSQADPVMPTLSYEPHVSHIGTGECPVNAIGLALGGLTTCPLASVVNISVEPVLGWYVVFATLDQTVTYQVCGDIGPQGQVDIPSETAPYITKENWWDVARDLTPNETGVPPRKMFWATDITLRHERFHAAEWVETARKTLPKVEQWLTGKLAASVDSVNGLLVDTAKQFQKKVGETVTPGSEERAYEDGKALYAQRARAIIERGEAGKYPAWDWKKGWP